MSERNCAVEDIDGEITEAIKKFIPLLISIESVFYISIEVQYGDPNGIAKVTRTTTGEKYGTNVPID